MNDMNESEKDAEITRLRERCALLDSLLGEALRYGYVDLNECSPSWMKEALKTITPGGLPMPFRDPEGRLRPEVLALLQRYPASELQRMLKREETLIHDALEQGLKSDLIPDCEQRISVIKSELARRGELE